MSAIAQSTSDNNVRGQLVSHSAACLGSCSGPRSLSKRWSHSLGSCPLDCSPHWSPSAGGAAKKPASWAISLNLVLRRPLAPPAPPPRPPSWRASWPEPAGHRDSIARPQERLSHACLKVSVWAQPHPWAHTSQSQALPGSPLLLGNLATPQIMTVLPADQVPSSRLPLAEDVQSGALPSSSPPEPR